MTVDDKDPDQPPGLIVVRVLALLGLIALASMEQFTEVSPNVMVYAILGAIALGPEGFDLLVSLLGRSK